MSAEELGLYGYRLSLPPGIAARDLAHVEQGAPEVGVSLREACFLEDRRGVDADRLALAWKRGSGFEVRRRPPQIAIDSPEVAIEEALVHPLLTAPMSILARWRGDIALHAGAFFHAGGAWGLIGNKGDGKSTTLAGLALRQVPLLTDDLLVLEGDMVRAGPACVDLRPDAAKELGEGRLLGEVGGRERYRVSALRGPARCQLRGFFVLAWAEEPGVRMEPVPTGEAMRILYEHEHMEVKGVGDVERIFDLLEKPMWRLTRPRSWSVAEEALDWLLQTAEDMG
jgi:hypothetical protein